MTKLLQDMLHERAASAPGPRVDVEAIIGSGESRVRRVRLTAGLAAAAVAAVVAGSSFVVPGLLAHDQEPPATAGTPSPFAERRAGYAMHGVIHWGDQSYRVGTDVDSYVQTDDGFVLANRKGDVLLFDGTGTQRIGRTTNRMLRADDTGSLVAWVDTADDGQPQYVVYDTSTGREVARVDDEVAGPARPGSEGDGGALVYAVDDGSVYWRSGERIVRYVVAAGDAPQVTRWVPTSGQSFPAGTVDLVDVAAGRLAYRVDGPDGRSDFYVGDRVAEQNPELPSGHNGYLSPDGRYVGVEDDDVMAVYDTGTGAPVTVAGLDGYPFTVVTGWVDADTAMVFAIKDLDADPYVFDMLECDVPSGACGIVTGGEVATDAESFVVPVGDPMT